MSHYPRSFVRNGLDSEVSRQAKLTSNAGIAEFLLANLIGRVALNGYISAFHGFNKAHRDYVNNGKRHQGEFLHALKGSGSSAHFVDFHSSLNRVELYYDGYYILV
jgi:hypothetical protein